MKSLGPCFNFYHDDYLGGTSAFNDRQHGAYLLLLIEQWRVGFLPADDSVLLSLARTKMRSSDYRWKAVKEKFEPCGEGIIRNAKMHAIRCERIAFIEKQRSAGKASADARKSNNSQPPLQPPLQPEGQPKGNPPSPSPLPSASPEDSVTTPYARVRACVPAEVRKPTDETIATWVRAYGIDLEQHEAVIVADLQSTPPNLWTKDGALRVKYAIANAADRHERSTRQSGMSWRERQFLEAQEAGAKSGL